LEDIPLRQCKTKRRMMTLAIRRAIAIRQALLDRQGHSWA
jgi:hypothetical protein